MTQIGSFVKCLVQCTIHSFYAQEGTVTEKYKLLIKLEEDTDFKGSCSSCRTVVRDLGFRWKKTRTNRGVLIESVYRT
jgi:hypothetical protein